MRVLVTGSEGFIGKNLVKLLEDEGHEVDGWDSKIGRDLSSLTDDYETDADVIYHLACINQMEAVGLPLSNLTVNAYYTKELAEMAARIGAKFVYTSTASVYGNAEVIPTPVDAKLQPLTDYAVAKLAGEFFVQNSGADWTILRLSNVYGPYQTVDNPYCGVIGRFFDQARKGEPLTIIGDGSQTRDFTYIDDVLHAIKEVSRLDGWKGWSQYEGGIINVSSGNQVPIFGLARRINALYGGDALKTIPERAIDGVTHRALLPGFQAATSLQEGLEKTKAWFDEQA